MKSHVTRVFNPFVQGNRICAVRECEAPAEPRFLIEHKLGRSLALPHFASESPYAIALSVRLVLGTKRMWLIGALWRRTLSARVANPCHKRRAT
jgi:hypothetical protein